MKKFHVFFVAASAAMLSITSAHASSGTFRQAHDIGMGAEAINVDPASQGRFWQVTEKTMSRLIRPGEGGKPDADLATEWSSNADATEWIFKLREGVAIGLKVTLRCNRMYEFWERLVCFSLPRVRDFKGLPPKAFDGRGNYTIGLKEQLIFPEINFDKIEKIK